MCYHFSCRTDVHFLYLCRVHFHMPYFFLILGIDLWRVCVLSPFSHVQLIVTLWTAAHQALLSMGFSRQEYWSGLPCSPLGDLPNPGIEPASPMSPALAGGFFTTSATWEALTAGGVRLIYSFTPHVQAFRWGLQQCQYFPQDYMLTFHQ